MENEQEPCMENERPCFPQASVTFTLHLQSTGVAAGAGSKE